MEKARVFSAFLMMVFAGFAAGCGGSDGGKVANKQVSVTDPAGDVDAGSKADLTSATIEQAGDNLTITVKLAPGDFDPLLSDVDIVMDMDMNPATGDSTDAGLIGGEYIIEMGSACLGSKANVLQYNSATTHWDSVGSYDVTFLSEGMQVTVPVSLLNGYSGKFAFWFESAREIGQCSYTGRIDSMPDMGTTPAVFQ
ncbi:MAG: hypothetical protein M0Z60_03040 [Nitrospiraceae bacterium]|nr:hypothetical protein [Nitrospiraceae bacterium]